MQRLIETLKTVATTNVPVLLQGESGTGKELCVNWLYRFSGNHKAALVKVSCPALPQALLETELFGYEKGAFTGANDTRPGRVEQAQDGMLFLDEIGDLDLGVQVKLLRFLQDNSFSRVGGHDLLKVNTRLVCTANCDLTEQVAAGAFRLDLLYRINAVSLNVPPLRARSEDIPQVMDFLLDRYSNSFNTKPPAIPRDVMRSLVTYAWPGNFRQLDNVIRSFALLCTLDSLVPEEAFRNKSTPTQIDVSKPSSLKSITREATKDLERQIILGALKANGWHRRKTADWLKISYRSLLYKLDSFTAQGFETPVIPRAPKQALKSGQPQLRQE